jgi:hypothetical protein
MGEIYEVIAEYPGYNSPSISLKKCKPDATDYPAFIPIK